MLKYLCVVWSEVILKKIECVEHGAIVEGTVLKNGSISEKGRRDVTRECVTAIMKHMIYMKQFLMHCISGYESGDLVLVLFDREKYKIVTAEGKEVSFGNQNEEE